MKKDNPPAGTHVSGNPKGEERRSHGPEAGRGEKDKKGYRTTRDSTGVNPKQQSPTDPKMPDMPPA